MLDLSRAFRIWNAEVAADVDVVDVAVDAVLGTVGASILGLETYGFFIFGSLVLRVLPFGLVSSRASALLCLACSVDIRSANRHACCHY